MHYQQAERQQQEQDDQSDKSDADIRSSGSNRDAAWSSLQITSLYCNKDDYDENDLKEVLLLDSGTTTSLLGNKKFVHGIRQADSIMRIETNAGTRLISEDAILPGLGKVKLHKDAIANVLSLNELSKIYRVTIDTSKENGK